MEVQRAEALTRAESRSKGQLELEVVYRDYSAQVSKWVQRLWGPGADAEDLLHEVFLVVHKRLGTYRGQAALGTWLYAITVRVVSARRRKERWRQMLMLRVTPELELDAQPSSPADANFQRAETARVVYSVLDALAERDRSLLIAFELEHLPGAELALSFGIKESAVWVALGRARERFRREYERRYGPVPEEVLDEAH